MHMTLDYRIVGPGMFMTATSYGLGRYAYGLFIPTFRDAFSLTDTRLALIASFSYGSYFLVILIGIYISSRLDPITIFVFELHKSGFAFNEHMAAKSGSASTITCCAFGPIVFLTSAEITP